MTKPIRVQHAEQRKAWRDSDAVLLDALKNAFPEAAPSDLNDLGVTISTFLLQNGYDIVRIEDIK